VQKLVSNFKQIDYFHVICSICLLPSFWKSSESINTPLEIWSAALRRRTLHLISVHLTTGQSCSKTPFVCNDVKTTRNNRQPWSIINIVGDHATAPTKATDIRLLSLPLELHLPISKAILKGWLVHHNIVSANANFESHPTLRTFFKLAARKSFVSRFPVPCVPGPSKAVNQPDRTMRHVKIRVVGRSADQDRLRKGTARLPNQSDSAFRVLYYEQVARADAQASLLHLPALTRATMQMRYRESR
jgi:hypothetical protein